MLGCAVSRSASVNPLSDALMLFSKSVVDDMVLGAVRSTRGAIMAQFIKLRHNWLEKWRS